MSTVTGTAVNDYVRNTLFRCAGVADSDKEAIAALPWRFEFGGNVPVDVPLTMYGVERGASTYHSQVDPVSKRVISYALITIVEKATTPDRGIAYRMLTKKILCKLTESKKHGHAKQKRAGRH